MRQSRAYLYRGHSCTLVLLALKRRRNKMLHWHSAVSALDQAFRSKHSSLRVKNLLAMMVENGLITQMDRGGDHRMTEAGEQYLREQLRAYPFLSEAYR